MIPNGKWSTTENYLPNEAIVKHWAKCQFTAEYWNYERKAMVDYSCPDDEEILGSGLCIFHDENYLKEEDKDNRKEHE